MFEPLIALAVFAGTVWVIAYAILLLLRKDADSSVPRRDEDPITRFVEENYGSHFLPHGPLMDDGLRRL
ncbi:MAG: hypothetical protein JWN94_249 [Betaproteobacteria bacterium]|nr:hypothetical protein [Betaproteobacteria bacterium]